MPEAWARATESVKSFVEKNASSTVKKDLAKLMKHVDKLVEEKESLDEEKISLSNDLRKSQTKVEELAAAVHKADKQRAKWAANEKVTREEMQAEIDKLQEEKAQMQEETEHLTQKLEKLHRQHASRQRDASAHEPAASSSQHKHPRPQAERTSTARFPDSDAPNETLPPNETVPPRKGMRVKAKYMASKGYAKQRCPLSARSIPGHLPLGGPPKGASMPIEPAH